MVTSANYFHLLGAGASTRPPLRARGRCPWILRRSRDQRRSLAPRVRRLARRHRTQGRHGHRHLHDRRCHAARLPPSRRNSARRRGHVERVRLRRGAVHEPAAAPAELHSRRDGTSQARHPAAPGAGSSRRAGGRPAVGLSGELSCERAVGAAPRGRADRADESGQTAAPPADGRGRTAARHRVRQHREPHARAGVEPRARNRGAACAGRDARSAGAPTARREPRRRDRRRGRRAHRAGVVKGLDRRHAASRPPAADRRYGSTAAWSRSAWRCR